MKTIKNILIFTVLGLSFLACKPSKEARIDEITKAQQESVDVYDTTKLNRLLSLYRSYVADYPTDSMAAEYLFLSGRTSMVLMDGQQALVDFANLIKQYPGSRLVAESYFHRAYVYENVFYDISNAKVAYEDFINRYPDHPLADDAVLSIRYLGKDPAEIVASFADQSSEENTDHNIGK